MSQSKLDTIINFSVILNRGHASDSACRHFASLNHPQLISAFITYVELHKDLIGLTKIEDRQSINDNGCDIFVELKGNVKIGIQIKSPNDVAQKDFSNKVKAQFAESNALGLDKYYILICCAMTTKNRPKVNYIVSHFGAYQTNYHVVLNPNNCLQIFNPGSALPPDEFQSTRSLYTILERRTELEKILQDIKQELNKSVGRSTTNISKAIEAVRDNNAQFVEIQSLDKLASSCDVTGLKEKEELRLDVNRYFKIVHSLSEELRNFYYFLLEKSEYDSTSSGLEVSLTEIVSFLNTNPSEVREKSLILCRPKYGLAKYDEDEPSSLRVNHYGDSTDVNIAMEVKNLCSESNVPLKKVLIDYDFSILN